MADVMKSKVVAIGEALTELLQAPSGVAAVTVVTMLQIGNVNGTDDATFTLKLNKDGGSDVNMMVGVNVEAGKAVIVYSDANGKLFLERISTPDMLRAQASHNGRLVATISYIERT